MIRPAREDELARLLKLYDAARAYMRAHGNMSQWVNGYPQPELLLSDIARGALFAMEDERGSVYGCFALLSGVESTYLHIEGEGWRSDSPYATIHRIASDGTRRDVFARCVDFARQKHDHLRVDTHADNQTMRRAILRQGFVYRGIIYLEDGAPRLAYDWLLDADGAIRPMAERDRADVLAMMRVFYASPALLTHGSETIFQADVDACVGDSPYLEGYVYEDARGVQGYAMVARSYTTEFGRPCVWIEDLYLNENCRGRGVGSRFFDYIENRYPDAALRLEVERGNEKAVALYKKRGFAPVSYLGMAKLRGTKHDERA